MPYVKRPNTRKHRLRSEHDSLTESASKFGIHRNSLSNIESQHRPASMRLIERMADAYGVEPEDLIDTAFTAERAASHRDRRAA